MWLPRVRSLLSNSFSLPYIFLQNKSLFFFYLFHIKETLIVEMLIWCNKIVLFMLLFILGPFNTLYISFHVRTFTPCYIISSCKGFAHCWEPNMKLLIYLTFGCIWIVVHLGIITTYITFLYYLFNRMIQSLSSKF